MCDREDRDLYAVLGASPSENTQQLRRRYQQLALQFHPDRLGGSCPPEAGRGGRFVEVEAAWRVLSDQNTRRQYDLQRRAQELRQDGPEDSAVALQDLSWDPEECVYTHSCRCGGRFILPEEEVEEQRQRVQREEEEEEEEEEAGRPGGVLVCCDTCSLTVFVRWPADGNTSEWK